MKRLFTSMIISCLAIAAGAQNVAKDSLEFTQGVAQSFLGILEGQVAGVNIAATDGNVNSANNVYIRGLNALHTDSQPLIIVDGVILTSSLNQNLNAFYDNPQTCYTSPLNGFGFLSTYEIEKIEVLSDISATALYGSKAANGVLIVTTKKARTEGRNIQLRSNLVTDFATAGNGNFSPAVSHNHNIAITSNVKGRTVGVSGFFRGTNGVTKGTGNNTGGLAVKFDTRTNPYVWFSFSSYTGITSQNSSAGTAYLGHASRMLVTRYPSIFSDDTIEGWVADYDDKVMDYRSVNSAELKLNILHGLSLKMSVGADFDSNQRNIWYGNGTSFGLANNGAASVLESTLFNYNTEVELEYARFFAEKHHVEVKGYFDANGNANKFNTMCGYDFFVHDLRGKGLSIMGSDKKLNKFQRTYNELGGGFAAAYDYDGIIGANAALTLGVTPKYGSEPELFPSANVFADLHKAFFADFTAVSSLKLNAGYGAAGREYYIPYELTGNYYTGLYPSVHPGAETFYDSLNRLYSKEWNAGIQLGFLNDRIQVGLKYYDKTTEDKFSMYCFGAYSEEAELWAYSDRQFVFTNSDVIRNRGFEGQFSAELLNSDKMSLKVYGNGSLNINQIIETNGDNVRGMNIGNNSFMNANIKGQSVSALFGYVEDGDGGYVDRFKDGVLDDMDKVVLANAIPRYMGNFGITFTCGAVAVDFLGRLVGGHHVANLNKMIEDGKTDLSLSYIEDGTYARISRLAVSYTFKFRNKYIKDLKLTLSGHDLLTATKYSGWNPDVNCFGSSALSYGLDYGSYPSTAKILFGVCCNF